MSDVEEKSEHETIEATGPPLSKSAVISFISALAGTILLMCGFISPPFLMLIKGDLEIPEERERSLVFIYLLTVFTIFCLSCILGILSLIKIRLHKNRMRGNIYAISAIAISLFFIFSGIFVHYLFTKVESLREEKEQTTAVNSNMQKLHKSLSEYIKTNNGYLPDANQWSDLLIKSDPNLKMETFKNPKSTSKDYGIAFNKNLSGIYIKDIPGNVVLFFESSGDWNLKGDNILLLRKENKRKWVIGVMFADGSFGAYFYNGSISGCHSDKYSYIPLHWQP